MDLITAFRSTIFSVSLSVLKEGGACDLGRSEALDYLKHHEGFTISNAPEDSAEDHATITFTGAQLLDETDESLFEGRGYMDYARQDPDFCATLVDSGGLAVALLSDCSSLPFHFFCLRVAQVYKGMHPDVTSLILNDANSHGAYRALRSGSTCPQIRVLALVAYGLEVAREIDKEGRDDTRVACIAFAERCQTSNEILSYTRLEGDHPDTRAAYQRHVDKNAYYSMEDYEDAVALHARQRQ